MQSFIKRIIKNLPGVSRLVAQRQELILDLTETRRQCDILSSKLENMDDSFKDTCLKHQEALSGIREAELKLKQSEVDKQRSEIELSELKVKQGFVPPGHFYSPVPELEDVKRNRNRIFHADSKTVAGVSFNDKQQLALLEEFVAYYKELPFKTNKQPGLRYFYDNTAFSYSDAILLHCMIRKVKPERIIEVGSGFSSCMALDTNELFFDGCIETTFIEPYPDLLHSLLKKTDMDTIKIIPSSLQDVPLSEFDSLQANDILFIDSTHVSKIDSDVNRIIFDILPRLNTGVYVHFHDIFFPFEYPEEWVMQGRAWNEAYMLKAFLQYNQSYNIILMNSYLRQFHRPWLEDNLPLCLKNTGSLWMQKI